MQKYVGTCITLSRNTYHPHERSHLLAEFHSQPTTNLVGASRQHPGPWRAVSSNKVVTQWGDGRTRPMPQQSQQ